MSLRLDTHVLGCKVNYADTQRLVELLPGTTRGQVALVGTCCVTSEAARQSRKHVRRESRRLGVGGTVFVTGCALRLDPESFRGIADNVVVLEGNAREAAQQARRELDRESSPPLAGAMLDDGQSSGDDPNPRTRYFLKVQDGCANHCSYCIIPQVRGRPRSLPASALLKEAANRVAQGFPELVVSGINVGAYKDNCTDLAGLLRQIGAIEGLLRLRLSSIEVMDITRELLEIMAAAENFARHLHVPLQSGDDLVLADMGRRYNGRLFREKLELVRRILPGVNITTDAIVGFPGEDEAAFENTLELVEAAGISKVHVFGFSTRPGTPAEARTDRVPPDIIKERSRELRELSDLQGGTHRRRKLDRVSEILLESAVSPGRYTGLSGDYTRFIVTSEADSRVALDAGRITQAMGVGVTADAVMGKVIG